MNKRLVKTCCGGKSWVYELNKPLTRDHVPKFVEQGFTSAEHFARSGIFCVQKKHITATATFGSKRMSVRFSGPESVIKEFDDLLNTLVNENI